MAGAQLDCTTVMVSGALWSMRRVGKIPIGSIGLGRQFRIGSVFRCYNKFRLDATPCRLLTEQRSTLAKLDSLLGRF